MLDVQRVDHLGEVEQDAVGGVVRSVHQHVPGVPVLVIDDCSADDTISNTRQAGAEVLALPHHLGLGGCVQAGYKLAYELGYDYVIRMDGDGQHPPECLPAFVAAAEAGATIDLAVIADAYSRLAATSDAVVVEGAVATGLAAATFVPR